MICSAAQLQPSVRQERHNIPLPEERGVLLEAEGMLHCGKCESVPLFLTLLIFFLNGSCSQTCFLCYNENKECLPHLQILVLYLFTFYTGVQLLGFCRFKLK